MVLVSKMVTKTEIIALAFVEYKFRVCQGLFSIEKALDVIACLEKALNLHKALKSPRI